MNTTFDHGAHPPLDYGRSFLQGKYEVNQARFWVESRLWYVDRINGKTMVFYQCGSCKSEHTFAESDLFQQDNYDFLPVFGERCSVVFRRKAYLNPAYATYHKDGEPWGGLVYRLKEVANYRLLETGADVCSATREGFPIVARTEIRDDEKGVTAVMEYPVKTMNIQKDRLWYQTDTGPVVVPDFSKDYAHPVKSLIPAFIAFNRADFADFVLEAETPIMENGKEITRVHHYSKILTFQAKNLLYALCD